MEIRRSLGKAVGLLMIVLVSALGPSGATSSHAAGLPGIKAPKATAAGLPGFAAKGHAASAGLPG